MGSYDTLYRCTVCGREGKVARCCGDDTRVPLNDEAKIEFAWLLEKYPIPSKAVIKNTVTYEVEEIMEDDTWKSLTFPLDTLSKALEMLNGFSSPPRNYRSKEFLRIVKITKQVEVVYPPNVTEGN